MEESFDRTNQLRSVEHIENARYVALYPMRHSGLRNEKPLLAISHRGLCLRLFHEQPGGMRVENLLQPLLHCCFDFPFRSTAFDQQNDTKVVNVVTDVP